jgi:hypothetical protein
MAGRRLHLRLKRVNGGGLTVAMTMIIALTQPLAACLAWYCRSAFAANSGISSIPRDFSVLVSLPSWAERHVRRELLVPSKPASVTGGHCPFSSTHVQPARPGRGKHRDGPVKGGRLEEITDSNPVRPATFRKLVWGESQKESDGSPADQAGQLSPWLPGRPVRPLARLTGEFECRRRGPQRVRGCYGSHKE